MTPRTTHSSPMTDEQFKIDLLALIPHARAFAFSMARRPDGEDLAQDAITKAWKSRATYQPGTNLKGWVFTILRNQYLSDKRRDWRSMPLDPEIAENMLISNDDPSAAEDLLDMRNAMQHLATDQREALVLVGAAALSYEEVAKICGCAIGTVKSRVNRGREALAAILEKRATGPRARSDISSAQVFEDIMQSATKLQRRIGPAQMAAAL